MGAPATYSTVGKNAFTRTWWLLMIALPVLTWWMWACAAFYEGRLVVPMTAEGWVDLASHVPGVNVPSVAFLVGWYALQIALQAWAPGPWVDGTPLHDGTRLPYKMNGWFSWWATLLLAAGLAWTGLVPATFLADQFGPILLVFNAATFAFAGWPKRAPLNQWHEPAALLAVHSTGVVVNGLNGARRASALVRYVDTVVFTPRTPLRSNAFSISPCAKNSPRPMR